MTTEERKLATIILTDIASDLLNSEHRDALFNNM
jgi:hypothetical protein